MNLVEQSFVNLVEFHREELQKISETKSATHIPVNKRRSLTKHGVITTNSHGKGTTWALTPEAIQVLKDSQKMTANIAHLGISETAPKGLLVPGPLQDLTNIEGVEK